MFNMLYDVIFFQILLWYSIWYITIVVTFSCDLWLICDHQTNPNSKFKKQNKIKVKIKNKIEIRKIKSIVHNSDTTSCGDTRYIR